MANLDYAWEKLALAVHSMAVDNHSLSDRLHGASLHFHTLKADDFPDDLREDFMKIEASLEAVMVSIPGTPVEGTMKAALDTMSDEELREIIKALCWLYDKVARRLPPGNILSPLTESEN